MALPATVLTAVTSSPRVLGLVHGPQSPLVDTKRTSARIAASDATVLLTGETGTGKEVFARFIHGGSPRANRPFVPVNCGAIPETLLESELFGYVKGAFTGAIAARRGRVALAEGGTLFLDEVGELPLSLQVKLLRLLQEKTYEPIGSSESVAASFRLITATNRDLGDEVRAGRFRSDLYYRLHVCPIHLPALRERRGDIAPLFQHFWSARGETRPIDAAVMHCLESYGWPGNVRELENLVERLSVCAEGEVIRMADLPLGVRAPHLGEVELQGLAGALPLEEVALLETGSAPLWVGSAAERAESAAATLPMTVPVTVPPFAGGAGEIATRLELRFPASLPGPAHAQAQARASVHLGGEGAGVAMATAPADVAGTAAPLEVTRLVSLPSLEAMAVDARAAALTPAREARGSGNTPTPVLDLPIDLPTMLRELENAYINAALVKTGSNKKEAARLLGMGRTTLVEKLRRRASDARPGLVGDGAGDGAAKDAD